VPIVIAATSKTPQRISQSTGPRRNDMANGCDPGAVARDIPGLLQMLAINFRIP
jgi:hypothetical protein